MELLTGHTREKAEVMLCDRVMNVRISGLEQRVACGNCEQCRRVRRRDVVGRALAESMDAKHTVVVTLTYGHSDRIARIDHPHAERLVYSDVQAWIKRIRARKIPGTDEYYKLRYMIAGEYGAQKGRAHWHCILFFYNAVPDHPKRQNWSEDPFWSEGFTFWDDADARTISYVAKYITKDDSRPDQETVFKASLRPILGAGQFRRWAELHVKNGLALRQGRKYQLPGVMSRKGKLFDYWMTPAAAKYVAKTYVALWQEKYGTHPAWSPMLDKYYDAEAKHRLLLLQQEALEERLKRGGYLRDKPRLAKVPAELPPPDYELFWDDKLMVYVADAFDARPRLYWSGRPGRERWSAELTPRKAGLHDVVGPRSAETLPDLPGEAEREFRRVRDVPEHVPGEALNLGKRRAVGTVAERREARELDNYHRAMVDARLSQVGESIRRLRDTAKGGS